MVWDGQCGFCQYWIIRWKMITGDKIDYVQFQDGSKNFPDVPEERFKEAVRLIETDGSISNGPQAAYRSLFLLEKQKWLYKLYERSKLFRSASDFLYQFVADNRDFFFVITKILFGKNPRRFKMYWIYFLLFPILIFLLIFSL